MRMILVATLAAFCLLGSMSTSRAGNYQADGSYQGSPSPAVSRLFAAEGFAISSREDLNSMVRCLILRTNRP